MAYCNCYQITLKECLQEIVIAGGFTPFTDYHVFITDKFENVEHLEISANYSGNLIITVADLPKGMFMSFSGSYSVQVFEEVVEGESCPVQPTGEPVVMEFCSGSYDCIEVSFEANEDDTVSQTIPDCDAEQTEIDEPFTAPQPYEDSFCPAVRRCLGISQSGDAQKFLNEQGQFVEVEPGISEETDPVFTNWLNTVAQVSNWNDAFGWGNHATAGYALDSDLTTLETTVSNHISDNANPHQTTLEQARTSDNYFEGEVDMNGNRLRNLPIPVNADEAVSKSYVDGLIDNTLKAPEAYNPSSGNYPATYGGNAIVKGDSFRITVAGTVGTQTVNAEDLLIANVNAPGQTDANWQILESNRDQATESVKGVAKVSSQADAQDELTSNNSDMLTPQKGWLMLVRFVLVAWTWAAKQTFTLAPRFSSVTASQFLKVDNNKDLTSVDKIQPSEVNTDANNRFVTDTEKNTWNAKQETSTTTTGTVIAFATPKIYGTVASPETGNVTDNLTGAAVGQIQKVYHNHSSAPTFPAGWVKISGAYVTGTLNIIYAEWVSGTRVEYWIVTL